MDSYCLQLNAEHTEAAQAPAISLRPYQKDAVAAAIKDWRAGTRSILEVLPTGAGKTIVFAELARLAGTRDKQTLILAHREELLSQAMDKVHFVWRDADIGLIRGNSNRPGRDVTVASVQSLHAERLAMLNPDRFRLVVIDEAHHAAAKSYRRILAHFSNALVLGVTATPKRADGKGLKGFDKVSYRIGIPDLIEQGYLVPMVSRRVALDMNLDGVRKSAGDFDLKQLGELFDDIKYHSPVVRAWLEAKASGRKRGLAFCVDVHHSEETARAFRSAGVRADCVHGGLPRERRASILAAYHRGDLEVLTNCNVLTEGFDEPAVDTLLMIRPTLSQALYIQMAGRGLRLHPGKDDCLVYDFVGNTRYPLMQSGNCLKDDYAASGSSSRVAERIALHWTAVDDSFVLQAIDGSGDKHHFRLDLVDRNSGLYRATRTCRKMTQVIAEAPLSWAQGQAEEVAREIIPKDKLWMHKKNAAWRDSNASDKQIALLHRMGVPIPPKLTKGAAADLITSIYNR